MFNLFDSYHELSRDLHQSQKAAGLVWPTIVLDDDGYLPKGVTSPYRHYMGPETGIPLHFNQIKTPNLWEIHGSGSSAQVKDYHRLKANIHYHNQGNNTRWVQAVDWLDEVGRLVWTDCYNQYGRRYAEVIYNQQGERRLKTYYDVSGREVITENLVNGQVQLLQGGRLQVFSNRVEFIIHYLKKADLDLSAMTINSLSTPFFVSHQLGLAGQDVLVWQEPIGTEIPGNMQMILRAETARTQRILVPDQTTYQRMLTVAEESQLSTDRVKPLGYVYPFQAKTLVSQDALILTNSDQIEGLTAIVEGLPQLTIHIGAITEMSDKLMAYERYDNVQLYPNISMSKIKDLLARCAFYLDINYANEIVDAVRAAFEYEAVILAFKETLHHSSYLDPKNIYAAQEVDAMIRRLECLLLDDKHYYAALSDQQQHSNSLTPEDFLMTWNEAVCP